MAVLQEGGLGRHCSSSTVRLGKHALDSLSKPHSSSL